MSINFDDAYVVNPAFVVGDIIFPPPPNEEINRIDNVNNINKEYGNEVFLAPDCGSLPDLNQKLGACFANYPVLRIERDEFDNSYTYWIENPEEPGQVLRIIIKLFRDNSNQYAIQVNSFMHGRGLEELRWSFKRSLDETGFERL
jgi:hypothetical protein